MNAPDRAAGLFERTRALFDLPDGLVYLDGNSLGPPPRGVRERLERTLGKEWGGLLIRGWNQAGWIDLPQRIAARIAPLIGAPAESIAVGDSTSVNLHKTISAALALRPERRVILSDCGNFPTDLYVAQTLAAALGRGHELRLVLPELVADAVDQSVALVMLTEVDYRSGRRHDMAAVTGAAHRAGALALWDLSHSTGALPVDLTGAEADFAVGCGYKYLNGGPGAPAYLHVRPDHLEGLAPALGGWMGHAAPFAFERDYQPAEGIARMAVGTPPILALAALDAALEVWEEVDLALVRERSVELTELFIAEVERRCGAHGVACASPRAPGERGSHVSFRHPEGYAVMQALIDRGVIGDFRMPDLMRFGFAPLYNGPDDAVAAAECLERVLRERLWDRPEYKARAKVT